MTRPETFKHQNAKLGLELLDGYRADGKYVGMSRLEISTATGIKIDTIKKIEKKALAKLRKDPNLIKFFKGLED